MKQLVDEVKTAALALGSDYGYQVSKKKNQYLSAHLCHKNIKKGEKLTENNIRIIRPVMV